MDPVLASRLDKAERDGVSLKRTSTYRSAYAHYDGYLRRRNLSASTITTREYEDFVLWLQSKGALTSVKVWLACIKAAYAYRQAVSDVWLNNPTTTYRLRPAPDTAPTIFTMDELSRLYQAAQDERDATLFYLLTFTGLRVSEARTLRWDAVDFETKTITVVGKGGKLRHVPLHPSLNVYLAGLEDRGRYILKSLHHVHATDAPLSESTVDRMVVGLMSRAGVEGTAHTFRRTVGTSLSRDTDARESTIDRIMGWAPRSVKDRHYINVADAAMTRAMRDLYSGRWSSADLAVA